MSSSERREKLIEILKNSKEPVTGKQLSALLGVSRQVVVQYINYLRDNDYNIIATVSGYILGDDRVKRVFKVNHSDEATIDELNLIVEYGGSIEDVFIYHKVYGTIKGDLHLSSKKEIEDYMLSLKQGKSTYLKNATSGYHYHTVSASSEAILDVIQEKLNEKGFLAKLQDYEPVDFWKESVDE